MGGLVELRQGRDLVFVVVDFWDYFSVFFVGEVDYQTEAWGQYPDWRLRS
jgi:hypothetical protein